MKILGPGDSPSRLHCPQHSLKSARGSPGSAFPARTRNPISAGGPAVHVDRRRPGFANTNVAPVDRRPVVAADLDVELFARRHVFRRPVWPSPRSRRSCAGSVSFQGSRKLHGRGGLSSGIRDGHIDRSAPLSEKTQTVQQDKFSSRPDACAAVLASALAPERQTKSRRTRFGRPAGSFDKT